MNASDLFKAGKLQEAVRTQLEAVRNNPADAGQRLFLFELLAFAGELERARRQIEACLCGDQLKDLGHLLYRGCLDSEAARRQALASGQPNFIMDPPEHLRLRLDALHQLREKRPAEAAALLNQAIERTPTVAGTVNGQAVHNLRDCDDLFSHVLEVFKSGRYFWVPYDQVASVVSQQPQYPRDLLWLPVILTLVDGQEGEAFLPLLYPGSHESPDDRIKLGYLTDWKVEENAPVLGVGRHTLLLEDDVISLAECREILLKTPEATP